jgi:Protein of unknown function (DUF3108)
MIFRGLRSSFARNRITRSGPWLLCLAIAGFAGAPLLISQSPSRPKTAPANRRAVSQPPPRAAAREATVPFKVQEQLAFQVLFSKFTVKAGEIQFNVVEHRDFFGRPAWHFRLAAQSVETVRILYPLDDQFDSYTDAVRLTSLQYETYLRESGQKQDRIWRMDTGEEPIPAGVSAVRVKPGTRDPLGLLYALRAADWRNSPDLQVPVFEGSHLYDVQARQAEGTSLIKVAAGQFNASQIRVRVFENGRELTDTSFSVWLADDAGRTPVLIEAALPIGSARVELTSRR